MIHITKEQEPLYQEVIDASYSSNKSRRKWGMQLSKLKSTKTHSYSSIKPLKRMNSPWDSLRKWGEIAQSMSPLEERIFFNSFSFLRKDKDSTIKEFTGANEKLIESSKEMEAKIKVLTEKAN